MNIRVGQVVAFGYAVLGGGCDLIDQIQNLDHVNFTLPKRTYSVDTQDPNWKSPPQGGIPAAPCGPQGPIQNCCMPAPGVTIDCARSPLSCETGACALRFTYERVQQINLGGDVSALKALNKTLTDVILKQIDIKIETNTMNTEVPPVDLFVGPMGATKSTDSGVTKIGTVPATPTMFTADRILALDENAQRAFSALAKDYKTPFQIMLSTTVLIKSGADTPMGKLDLVISGKVEAHF